MTMILTRRGMTGLMAAALSMPLVARFRSLMPVRSVGLVISATELPFRPRLEDGILGLYVPDDGWGVLADGTLLAWGTGREANIAFPCKFGAPPSVLINGRHDLQPALEAVNAGDHYRWTARGPA